MSEFKVGDRVRAEFEATISSILLDNAYFSGGIDTLAAPLSSLTKLTDPIPTANGAVIRFDADGSVAVKVGDSWSENDSYERVSDADMQSDADRYGFTVLYAGDES